MGDFGGDVLQAHVDPFGKQAGADAATDAAGIQAAASREAIAEQRRQFDSIQALLAPFLDSGTGALPALNAGATTEGLDQRIGSIMGGQAFQSLVGERTRSVQGQLGASGLMRSGGALLEAARIPTELAMAIEEQLYGRQSALADRGQNAAVMQGNAGMNTGNSVARLLQEQGAANAQGIIGAQQARAASSQSMLQTGLTAAAIFFSDPRLKENMAPIGKIGPLTLYEWDWIEGVSDVIGRMSIGFNADEVEEHFPEFVVEAHGFKAIHYPLLTAELRARYGH